MARKKKLQQGPQRKLSDASAASSSSSTTGQELLNFRFAAPAPAATAASSARGGGGGRPRSGSYPSSPPPSPRGQLQRSISRGGGGGGSRQQRGGGGGGRSSGGRGRGGRGKSSKGGGGGGGIDANRSRKDFFFLYTSPDHAFVITRQKKNTAASTSATSQATHYSFDGIDNPVSWGCVRIVKCLVNNAGASHDNHEECPICLDKFCCPRVTKCGHAFCLDCLIHHIRSYSSSHPHQADVKCPCCAVPIHLCGVRPVVFQHVVNPTTVTATAATVPAYAAQKKKGNKGGGSPTMAFAKLHRHKNCGSPYLPLPDKPRRLSPVALPEYPTDADANYSKLNYVCPEFYKQLLSDHLEQIQNSVASSPTDQEGAACRTLAIDFVCGEVQKASDEEPIELECAARFSNPSAGVYRLQPAHLIHYSDRGGAAAAACDEGAAEASADSAATGKHAGGSMYLLDENEDNDGETLFYQSQDGSLCFLSAFNVKNLQYEFSTTAPSPLSTTGDGDGDDIIIRPTATASATTDTAPGRDHDDVEKEEETAEQHTATGAAKKHTKKKNNNATLPLPDVVEGRILQVDRVTLTPAVRNWMRFLSHLPLYTDVTFVELALGHLLSKETRNTFNKEFQRRQRDRKQVADAKQRSKRREMRREQKRIDELKARFQRIDPDDEFFHQPVSQQVDDIPTGDEFGPSVGSSSAEHAADGGEDETTAANASSPPPPSSSRPIAVLEHGNRVLTFSQICSTSGPTITRESDFPALGGSSSPQPNTDTATPARRTALPPQPWGRPAPKLVSSELPAPAAAAATGTRKKSNKGKKVLLFSTGGGQHHGGN